METISWYITSTKTRFSTSKYAQNSCTCLFDLQTMKFGVDTTETGRPRIQRYARQLILSPKLTTRVTWLCFSNQKCELRWSHSWAFGRPKIGQVLSQPTYRSFHLQVNVLSVATLHHYILNSDPSDTQTTKPAIREECDHVSSPFWLDKQSHMT